jgi:hypothetical protein
MKDFFKLRESVEDEKLKQDFEKTALGVFKTLLSLYPEGIAGEIGEYNDLVNFKLRDIMFENLGYNKSKEMESLVAFLPSSFKISWAQVASDYMPYGPGSESDLKKLIKSGDFEGALDMIDELEYAFTDLLEKEKGWLIDSSMREKSPASWPWIDPSELKDVNGSNASSSAKKKYERTLMKIKKAPSSYTRTVSKYAVSIQDTSTRKKKALKNLSAFKKASKEHEKLQSIAGSMGVKPSWERT